MSESPNSKYCTFALQIAKTIAADTPTRTHPGTLTHTSTQMRPTRMRIRFVLRYDTDAIYPLYDALCTRARSELKPKRRERFERARLSAPCSTLLLLHGRSGVCVCVCECDSVGALGKRVTRHNSKSLHFKDTFASHAVTQLLYYLPS